MIVKNKTAVVEPEAAPTCLSCGAAITSRNRKYCAIDCRQRLRRMLNIRTGLLKTLNARFATFYFTDITIILDILPYGSTDIFSFIYPRTIGKKPSEDFNKMANILGNIWWAEKKRTNKGYLASLYVLDKARKNHVRSASVKPIELKYPSIKGAALLHLKIGNSDLNKPNCFQVIKSAFRDQAKKHHPDHGGDSKSFRRIQQSYEALLAWAENPSFVKRRGFPDKWFYGGDRNAWVQPVSLK